MNIFQKAARLVRSTLMRFIGAGRNWWGSAGLGRTNYNYEKQVGDGRGNSIVMACVNWIARTFPEAPVQVVEVEEDGHEVPVPDHPMIDLLEQPNNYYPGELLMQAALVDRTLTGNAYLIKRRNGFEEPVELWWAPSWTMTPKWPHDGSEFLTHYEYNPNGQPIRLDPEDVIHFRWGLDPDNTRLGLSPLASLFREIFTDDEAANFSASLLRNMAVPGVIIAPGSDSVPQVSPDDAEAIKESFKQKFGGDKRGEPMIFPVAANVQTVSFSPEQMNLQRLRQIPEERVSAVLGIPAAVVGLGTGLEQTKVGAPQPLSARLWAPEGPTTMGDIDVGDVIATPSGWRPVEATYQQGEQDIYRITFQDGSTAESTMEHLWRVHTPNQGWRTEPLSEIASWPWWKLKRAHLPLQGVTEFECQECLIPPYIMGLLLADGSFRRNLFISNSSEEIIQLVRERLPAGYLLTNRQEKDYGIVYRDHAKGRGLGNGTGDLNPFIDELRRLGLWMCYSQEKFVPDLYKYNSSRVRRELLQGILDGDGYVNLHGQPALEQTSEQLARDVKEIVESLGGYTLESEKEADTSERMINGRPLRSHHDRVHQSIVVADAESLFKYSEKKEACRPRKKDATRKFRKVAKVRREEAKCIKIDGSLYLTDSFLVTHNTMSELREMAWESNIVPTQRLMAAELKTQLLADFEEDLERYRVGFDLSNVRVLQDDQNDLYERVNTAVQGGWLTVARAKEIVGEVPDPEDAVYLRKMNVIEVPTGGGEPVTEERGRKQNKAVDDPTGDDLIWEGKAEYSQAGHSDLAARIARQMVREAQQYAGRFEEDIERGLMRVADLVMNYIDDHKSRKAEPSEWPSILRRMAANEVVLQRMMDDLQPEMEEEITGIYTRYYTAIFETTVGTVSEDLGLETAVDIPDRVTRQLIREGSEGIVDITEQTREAVANALADGREAGDGADALARRIRGYVEGSDMFPGIAERRGDLAARQYRAETIARTETKYAQNASSIRAYEAVDFVEALEVFDGAECGWETHDDPQKANGMIVSFQEARGHELAHPRCIRSFGPVVKERET